MVPLLSESSWLKLGELPLAEPPEPPTPPPADPPMLPLLSSAPWAYTAPLIASSTLAAKATPGMKRLFMINLLA
jgi:hypothetical protein